MKTPHAKLAYDRFGDPKRIMSMYNQAFITKNQHGTRYEFKDGSVLLVTSGPFKVKWRAINNVSWVGEREL